MAAATVRADYYGASATLPAGVTAETGAAWSLDDAKSGTTAIAIPSTTGTNYSWYKYLGLDVTATGTTTLTNRTVASSATLTTGLFLYWQATASASYTQPSSGNKPANSGSNGATPAGYTLMTTTPAQYDNTSVATSGTGLNGKLAQIVFGVDNTYTAGAGSAISLGNLLIAYDEA
jgi:hypothetical protein